MYTSTRGHGHTGEIDNEVTYLSEEVVLIDPIICTISVGDIRVRIDHGYALEARCCLDGWESEGVANELGIVELNDW